MVELVRSRVPTNWEGKLKAARLDLLALFRSIDRVPIDARELPWSTFDELLDLDGDYAEALSILDQPSTQYDVGRMERDTRRSLARLPRLRSSFMAHFPAARRAQLEEKVALVRPTLTEQDAWHSIPGKDPMAGIPLDDDD